MSRKQSDFDKPSLYNAMSSATTPLAAVLKRFDLPRSSSNSENKDPDQYIIGLLIEYMVFRFYNFSS